MKEQLYVFLSIEVLSYQNEFIIYRCRNGDLLRVDLKNKKIEFVE